MSGRICFANEHDEVAPKLPVILAINCLGRAAGDAALANPGRAFAKAATGSILDRYILGRAYHHITVASEYKVSP